MSNFRVCNEGNFCVSQVKEVLTVGEQIFVGGSTSSTLNSLNSIAPTNGNIDLVAGANISIVDNDVAKTITFSSSGGSSNLTSEQLTLTGGTQNLNASLGLSELDISSGSTTGNLPNGTSVGQLKYIAVCAHGGGGASYACSVLSGAGGIFTMTFDAVQQSVVLVWTSGGWCRVGGTGALIT